MMNRKGMVFFWVLLVILLGVGISLMVNYTFQAGETKGVWALSFMRATQEAEKDLLVIDSRAQKVADNVSQEISSQIFKEDLGCGKVQGVTLWNKKEMFCPLKIQEEFSHRFNSIFDEQHFFNYTLIFQEQQLIGKTSQSKEVTPTTKGVIPTEGRSAGLFTFYEAYLIKPFDLRYNYNPGFRVKLDFSIDYYAELEQQARLLVRTCQDEADLKNCLDLNKEIDWKYGKCEKEEYLFDERKVLFCVGIKELFGIPFNRVNFALDFTSPAISSPKGVRVSLQGAQIKVSFNTVAEAEEYHLYYTNWDPASESYPQEAQKLFFASQGKYFYSKQKLSTPQACPIEHQVNVPYRCGDQIIYWLNDSKIIPGEYYYFAVTSLKESEESLVYEVVKLDSSG
jgi:hypothetical protein